MELHMLLQSCAGDLSTAQDIALLHQRLLSFAPENCTLAQEMARLRMRLLSCIMTLYMLILFILRPSLQFLRFLVSMASTMGRWTKKEICRWGSCSWLTRQLSILMTYTSTSGHLVNVLVRPQPGRQGDPEDARGNFHRQRFQ